MESKPRIVVLDGFTLNPGDLSWQRLQQLGECVIHDRTPAADVIARAGRADILLTNKTRLSAETIGTLPRLRYIGVLATGYNVVDVDAAANRNVVVTNVPNYWRSRLRSWSSHICWRSRDTCSTTPTRSAPVAGRMPTIGVFGIGRSLTWKD